MFSVDKNFFAKFLEIDKDELSDTVCELLKSIDLDYRVLEKKERDSTLLKILKLIDKDRQKIASPERVEIWRNGWNENLEYFKKNNYNLDSLLPKYIRQNQEIRLMGDFIKPNNPKFEYDFFSIYRYWIFETYLQNFDNIYEFGCGTGLNLVALSKINNSANLYGLDFVESSVEIINEISKRYVDKLYAKQFDMINPDFEYKLKNNSAIFTFGSIEQLGNKIDKFFDYIMENKPKRVIHLEPIYEFYDENNLLDYLAMTFHKKRGYTDRLYSKVKELENKGLIKIIKKKKANFGSLMMEGFSLLIWDIL